MREIASIVLAAGKGTRMKSDRAKVLHNLAGKPLVSYPLHLARAVGSTRISVVVGHQKKEVQEAVLNENIDGICLAHQEKQLGTGHAVIKGLSGLKGYKGPVLILSGDVPLLKKATVNGLKKAYSKSGGPVAFITFSPQNPSGYGRIIEEKGRAVAIREDRDCSAQEKKISKVNSGIYLIDSRFLKSATGKLKKDNSQGELYLTDLVAMAAKEGGVATVEAQADEVAGVNDRVDLANLERVMQSRISQGFMRAGVSLTHPDTVYIEAGCKIGKDSLVGAGVHILGSTRIGKGCVIEPGAIIRNSTIKDNAIIRAYSILDEAEVGKEAEVGPMGRLRPGAVLKQKAKVGNWVELKKVVMGEGSKANHLAYLGDGVVGKNVNIGAGCIFCNYDGFLKHHTVIEDDVFVGSDSQIVAPVTIGKGSYVASGSTVVSDVPAGALAISRGRQQNKLGFGTLLKKRLKAKKQRLAKKTGKSK